MADLYHVAGPAADAQATVVLLHGLGGHHFDTWRRGGRRTAWTADDTFWPRWLARDCKGIAVYSIGYDAPFSRWRGSAMHFTDQGDNILRRILAEPALAHGPLILIGHSLGGLMIKQLLRTADSLESSEVGASSMLGRIEKVAFLATPHAGSGFGTLADRLRILVRPSMATASLVRNDPSLRNLNHWYRIWADERGIAHRILTEHAPSRFGLIVKPDSADPGLARALPTAINTDHTGICKPADDKSDIYVFLKDFITRPVERPKSVVEAKIDQLPDEVADKVTEKVTQVLAARGEAAAVERQTIIELARRLKPNEALNVDQAVTEVTAAVDRYLDLERKGASPSNLGDLVHAVYAEIAERNRHGDFDGAAQVADKAFAELQRAEAERREASMRSSIAILQAGLEEQLLRRDAATAAQRVRMMAELEHPDDAAARFSTLRGTFDIFFRDGKDKGVNLNLEVAIEIARLAQASAYDRESRGTALEYLGLALTVLGERETGTAHLEQAVAALQAALDGRTRDRDPLTWAMAQTNLGNALQALGGRERNTERLKGAIEAFHSVLQVYTLEREPLEWARTQNNLGIALSSLGQLEDDTTRLEQAVEAFRSALQVYTREREAPLWAKAQNNLGSARMALGALLIELGELECGTAHLENAIEAFDSLLQERTRQREPLGRADTQLNRGIALRILGERDTNSARLQQAVKAFRSALLEYTDEREPRQRATTQDNLGDALRMLAEREGNRTRWEQAIKAFRSALLGYTREREPRHWASTQHKLGSALTALGEREDNTAHLEEAVEAFHSALQVHTREREPLDWARTQTGLAGALHALGQRRDDTASLGKAINAYQGALEAFEHAKADSSVAIVRDLLAEAEELLTQRRSS
jgi:tetratricopeptide (TPR) repeat protein/pimeloyl-ACP methyl ester carboxylesterase